MLWLALFFPKLPLEAQSERAASRQTALGAFVVERGHVCVADDAAEAAGVMPGMRFSTARSMLPEGRVIERDAVAVAREQRMLDALACFCGSITPNVCVAPPASLLLDIGACLRLFGGVHPIVSYLQSGCAERGLSVQVGVAPTPRGAEWLTHFDHGPSAHSRAPAVPKVSPGFSTIVGSASNVTFDNRESRYGIRPESSCLTVEALPDMLARLPLSVLTARVEVINRLRAFGAKNIGHLMAMPRAGLARRIGLEPVEQFLQALGELPDPRAPVAFPERFHQSVELPAPASDAAMIGFPARRLIADFCGWLSARQSGAVRCTLLLTPERRGLPVQRLELRLSVPSRDPARFQRLLRERLDRTPLAAPVGDVALEAGGSSEVMPLPGYSSSLLDTRQPTATIDELIDRLRARLGEDTVHGLCVHPDHRPECATRTAAIGFAEAGNNDGITFRPCMLIEPPEPLGELDGRPMRRGEPLDLLTGPERIESGWWDEGEAISDVESVEPSESGRFEGTQSADQSDYLNPSERREGLMDESERGRCARGDVRRDYFLAGSKYGECFWIFRDAGGWWMQGLGFFSRPSVGLPMPSERGISREEL